VRPGGGGGASAQLIRLIEPDGLPDTNNNNNPPARFPSAARGAPQPTRQPPTTFQELQIGGGGGGEEETLFVFQRPQLEDSEDSTVEEEEAAQLQPQSNSHQQQQHPHPIRLEDMFVFRPNNRTPLSRLVFEEDDFAAETVGRPSVLTTTTTVQLSPSPSPPSFSFFPAVTPTPQSELFRPLESLLTFAGSPSSSSSSSFVDGSNHIDGGHVRGGHDDLLLGGSSEPLRRDFADLRNEFAIVRATTNLTPDVTSPLQLATTTPRYRQNNLLLYFPLYCSFSY
jgi:hypothetical protein